MRLLLTAALFAVLSGPIAGTATDQAVRGVDHLPAKNGKEPKIETIRGTMQVADNNRVKIRTSATEVVGVQMDSQTRITVDGKSGAITDLKHGQAVVCTFARHAGMNVALTITATSAKK